MTTALLLPVFALVVGTTAPVVLVRSHWPDRAPCLGIAAWFAVSLAVLLSMLLTGLAMVVATTAPMGSNLVDVLHACVQALRAGHPAPDGAVVGAAGALLAMTVLLRSGYCLADEVLVARRGRRRQLDGLALVARRDPSVGALVVDDATVAVYCLPRLAGRGGEVVLTTGALTALDDAQLVAVLAHEQAHLRGRHHLVLTLTAALARAFPVVPAFRAAQAELGRLVELHADDVASRGSDRITVATALVRLAEAAVPAPALGAGGPTAVARVRRLVAPAQPLGRTPLGLVAAAVASTVAFPLLLVSTLPVATDAWCLMDLALV